MSMDIIDVAAVWAGHPVGFSLLTEGDRQFVAYYDEQRHMTVASRRLHERQWTYASLPQQIGWDSHNYVTLAADRDGYLHLSGNMHGGPLVYFRTTEPWNTQTFQQHAAMVGDLESRTTYPRFMRGPTGEMIFTYRHGGSGNGINIFNLYDPDTRAWRRLLDQPLFDGEGQRNAYPWRIVRGPDGFFHINWGWRETPDVRTNHDLSYARSPDLRHWETSRGEPLSLPITLATGEVVDPVTPGSAMWNCAQLAFDSQGRVVLSYHRHDEAGHTQAWNARLEDDGWRIYQTSRWSWHWDLRGRGSMPRLIDVHHVTPGDNPGELRQRFRHVKYGQGVWTLNEQTLQVIREDPLPSDWRDPYRNPESNFPGLEVHWLDGGRATDGRSYFLRWETLPTNQDRPHERIPEPSALRLFVVPETIPSPA